MKTLPLSRGMVAIVDDEDFDWLNQWKWSLSFAGNNPCVRRMVNRKGVRVRYRLSRLITNCPDGMWVDHANGDPLDNRRENLRICTPAQNAQNRRIRSDNTTGFKGIFPSNLKSKPFASSLIVNGESKYLGYFETAELAHAAYCSAAKEHFGEFARTS